MKNYMVMNSGLFQEWHVCISLVWYKDPDVKSMEEEGGFEIQKWRLYKGVEGSFGKKSAFGLKTCVVNYLFSPWCRQVIPLTLMDNFMAANNICS